MRPSRGSTPRRVFPWRSRMKTVPSGPTSTARAPAIDAAEGGAAVAREPLVPVPRDGGNLPAGAIAPPNPVIGGVGEEEVAGAVEGHVEGLVQPRLRRRAAVAGIPRPARPDRGADRRRGRE